MYKAGKKVLITALLVAVGGGLLIWAAADAQWVETISVDQLINSQTKYTAKTLQVFGKVVAGSIMHEGSDMRFGVAGEKGAAAMVNYAGQRAVTLNDGTEVLVKGTYDGKGVLKAETILTKCPSKYKGRDGGTK